MKLSQKIDFLVCLSLMLAVSLAQAIAGNMTPQVDPPHPRVYYKDNGSYIDIYNPNLEIRIVKTKANYQAAGRIDSIKWKGGSNIVASNPQFGHIYVFNLSSGTEKCKDPSDMTIASVLGNNTGKITISLTTTTVVDYDTGANSIDVVVTIKYIVYADFDAIFIYVTIDSSIISWLEVDSTYGQSLAFTPFTSYCASGRSYIGDFQRGQLIQDNTYKIPFSAKYDIITVNRTSDNLAVTLFPLTLTSTHGTLKDLTASTRVWQTKMRAITYDGEAIPYGSYMTNIRYGSAWLFNDADKNPFVITPWLIPNAVPYGIAHAYDEIPISPSEYNKTSPSADTPLTSAWFDWLDENPKRRVNLMLKLNSKKDYYTPNPNGFDLSWTWNGSFPLFNTSSTYKEWYQSLENRRVGFGLHAYHHDSPWEHEFSTVTNKTWITKTWDRIWEDFLTLGLRNSSLSHFKPPGYRMRGQTLEVISDYEVKFLHYGLVIGDPVICFVFDNSDGRKIIGGLNNVYPVEEVEYGNDPNSVYTCLRNNITDLGLVIGHGHTSNLQPNYNSVDSVFRRVENYFGDDLDYFLVHELVDYWHDVLLPLEYSYNSTTIERSTSDPRLTFKLLNSPYSINFGLVYTSTSLSPTAFELYAPNINTGTFKFTRLTGYTTLSNLTETTDELSFIIDAPSETTSTIKVYVADRGEPRRALGATSWSYNNATKILTATKVAHSSGQLIEIQWWGGRKIIPSHVYFHLWQQNTYINFASTTTLNNIIQTYEKLYLDQYWFRVENANLTILKFFMRYQLIFAVNAPSQETSITKVYVGDWREPTSVCATNGTLTWSYDPSAKTLTFTAIHSSWVEITVDWRIIGDVDRDGDVDYTDFVLLAGAYGSSMGQPAYEPEADFNLDGDVDYDDFIALAGNYGETFDAKSVMPNVLTIIMACVATLATKAVVPLAHKRKPKLELSKDSKNQSTTLSKSSR